MTENIMPDDITLNVLLLGGTGAMGEHLAHVLASDGHAVTVTTRRERNDEKNIRYVRGNAHDAEFLRSLLIKRFDVVVDFMVYNTGEFESRYLEMLAATPQYVFISSSRVYADSKMPITESSSRLLDVSGDKEYLKTDEYALAKARQEDLLHKSGRRNWTIIRPYITFSETRLQLGVLEKEQWLWRALHGRTIVFSKDIACHYTTLTYGLNVSEGIAAVLGKPSALGEVFHVAGPKVYRWEELFETYIGILTAHLGKRPKVLMLDKAINLSNPKAQYQVRYDRHYDRIFDCSKINRYIDVSKFLPAKEGLELCLQAFIRSPRYNGINTRREALLDRMTGEWAKPMEMPSFKSWIKYLILRTIYPKSKL